MSRRWLSTLLLACTLVTGDFHPATAQPSAGIVVTVGPAELVRGPDRATDTAFHTLNSTAGLRSYVANGTTWSSQGGSLETLPLQTAPALAPGTGFDSCGAWLNSVWQGDGVVHGWYHAETDCDYPATRKSVAYARSADGGATFTKPNYPFNQVITAPARYTDPAMDDEGDHHVIRVGDYLYLYFIASRDWQVRIARARVADAGRPRSWFKYYNGAFSEPGLGGESSPIDPSGALTRSWVTYNTFLKAFVGLSYEVIDGKYAGFGLMTSPDGVTGWTRMGSVVQFSGDEYWGRDALSPELAEYPSLLSLYGDSEMTGSAFWLYFMYLRPGEDFPDGRYLLRRRVILERTTSADPHSTISRIALGLYQYGDDSWATTTPADARYRLTGVPGYLFTQPIPNGVPVYDCYLPFWNDHMLVPGDSTCARGDVRVLGRLGWISTVDFAGAVAVYRCWDAGQTNHFLSTDPACNGKQAEWQLGYLAPAPSQPSASLVALSVYYDGARRDSWVTTRRASQPYLFEQRLGYLFRSQQPGSAPVYDCYLPFWEDHMLTIDDATCDGNQVLGRLGWIAREPFPGSTAVYRCWDAAATNHFLSLDSGCEGAQTEWRAGYLAVPPTGAALAQFPWPGPPQISDDVESPPEGHRLFLPEIRY